MKKTLREKFLGRYIRGLPEKIRVMTIFGKMGDNLRRCKCCGEVKREDEFYLSPKSSFEDKRGICIQCWDKTNGKYKNNPLPVTNNLTEFFT